jgi:hypothetical protein
MPQDENDAAHLRRYFRKDIWMTEQSVRHVVVLKFKSHITEQQIEAITDRFRNLKNEIPGITGFERGVNNSPEGANRGLTHVFLLTFENAAARDVYLPHPAHLAFVSFIGEHDAMEEVFIVDYVVQS